MLILFQSTFQDPQLDTHNLYITDGTETVSLVDTNVYLLDYTPRTPSRSGGTWQDVTESASVLFQADTSAAIQASINEIERLLYQGEMRQINPAQERVFVVQQLASESGTWRSEILSGRVELDEDTWRHWNVRSVEAQIIWTRRYFWEGAEAEAALAVAADAGGAGSTGGVTVYNCGSANWFDPDIIDGAIPAGVRLVIKPLSYQPRYNHYIGHSVGVDSSFDHHIEAEDGSGGTPLPTSGSPDTDLYSGGYYRRFPVTATSLATSITFTVLADDLGYADGGYFDALIRTANTPLAAGAINMQARLIIEGVELWRGPEVENNGRCLQSLGVVQLPPSLANVGGPLALSLIVYARVASGTQNLDLDWLQFLPVSEYRKLTPVSALTGYLVDTWVVDDGLDDALYISRGASYTTFKLPAMIGIGEQMTITPGVANRFYLLTDEKDYSGLIYETAISNTVRMFYRPRRLTA